MTTAILVILGILILAVIAIYNGLVKVKIRTEEAWSDITVQLKRRYDLIPNLVNTVKGYAKHEKEVFENVAKTRSQAMQAEGIKETAQAENQLQQALKSLFAVSENYPDLKANENFKHLQEEIVDAEDKIQAARRFYNGAVRNLNTKVKQFPSNVIAAMFGFKDRDYFEVDEAQQSAIKEPSEVKF